MLEPLPSPARHERHLVLINLSHTPCTSHGPLQCSLSVSLSGQYLTHFCVPFLKEIPLPSNPPASEGCVSCLVHHAQIVGDQKSQLIIDTSVARAPAERADSWCPIAMRSRSQMSGFPITDQSPSTGEIQVSTSTVANRFSKMTLTGQRIAMVDMVFASFPAFPYLP